MKTRPLFEMLLIAGLCGTLMAAPESQATKPLTMPQKISSLDKQGLTAAVLAAELGKLEKEAQTPEEKRAIYSRLLGYYTPAFYGSHLKNLWRDVKKANEYGDLLLGLLLEQAKTRPDDWAFLTGLRVAFNNPEHRNFHAGRREKIEEMLEQQARGDVQKAEIFLIRNKSAQVLELAGATPAQKAEATVQLLGTVDYGTRWYEYYMNTDKPLTDDQWKKMEMEELRLADNLVKMIPDDASAWIRAGEAYYIQGKADKADAYNREGYRLSKSGTVVRAAALIGLANAAMIQGDKVSALKNCEEILANPYPTSKVPNFGDKYGSFVFWALPLTQAQLLVPLLKGGDFDGYQLPWYTGCEVYPTARESDYTLDFIPLRSMTVVLGGGMAADDLRLKFLRQKMERIGIKVSIQAGAGKASEDGNFVVRINTDDAPPAPDKAQGYALKITPAGAWIRGFDKLGTTFGIVSLIQMISHEGSARIRCCEVRDWPEYPGRGFKQSRMNFNPNLLEFALMGKFSCVEEQSGSSLTYRAIGGNMPWTPLIKFGALEMARIFSAFGVNLYFGEDMYTMYPNMPLTSPRTFEFHKKIFSELAAAGGNVYYPNDDGRGGQAHPADKAATGGTNTNAKLDAKYLTKLYRAVKAEHPDFKIVFCPVYYFGPDSPTEYLNDPREPYLKSIREELDPEIEVFWNGPRVREGGKKKIHGEWAKREYGRKPAIYQNSFGHGLFNYLGDEAFQWCEKDDDPRGLMYDGFYDDITSFYYNLDDIALRGPFTMAYSAYMWNPKSYNAMGDSKRITAILYGKKMWDIIRPGNLALAYFDKFDLRFQMWPAAYAERDLVKTNYAIAQAAWDKATAYNPVAIKNMPNGYSHMIWWAGELARNIDTAKPWEERMTNDIAELRETAGKEVALNESKGDIFIPGICFIGGKQRTYGVLTPEAKAHHKCEPLGVRKAVFLEKQMTPFASAYTVFKADPARDYELTLMGMYEKNPDDKAAPMARVLVNGYTVFAGPTLMPESDWGTQKITIPAAVLNKDGGNRLEIINLEEGYGAQTPPFIVIVYAVIRGKN